MGRKTVIAIILAYVLILPFTLSKSAINPKDPRVTDYQSKKVDGTREEKLKLPDGISVKVTTISDHFEFARYFEFIMRPDPSLGEKDFRGHLQRTLGVLDSYQDVFKRSELSADYGRKFLGDLLASKEELGSNDAVCLTPGRYQIVKWSKIQGEAADCRVYFSFSIRPKKDGRLAYLVRYVSVM